MREGERFGAAARVVTARPRITLLVLVLLSLAAAGLALRLETRTGIDTLVSPSSDRAQANDRFKRDFGDDAVAILVVGSKGKGDLQRTLLSGDLGRLLRLEGCLSGNVPTSGLANLPPECGELSRLKPTKVVYGPGTFINTASNQINDELAVRVQAARQQAQGADRAARARAARAGKSAAAQRAAGRQASQQVQSAFTQLTLQLATRYGLTGLPSLNNAGFISALVFDTSKGQVGQPKSRFAYLFPSSNSALVQVRLKPGLTDAERGHVIRLIESVTRDPRLTPQSGARYVVTGIPVVVEGLGNAVKSAIFVLLGAALVLMAATLALVFSGRPRLLPLVLALGAAALTFGGLSLLGGALTMASIAVLPVLIGLAVDYAIQFQARHDELRRTRGLGPREAAIGAASVGGPTIAAAGVATAAGFLVLLLSPVPLVRGFGGLLVAGVLVALVCTFAGGFAALTWHGRKERRRAELGVPPVLPRLRERLSRLGGAVAGAAPAVAVSGAWRRGRLRGVERGERMIAYAMDRPERVLSVGLVVAVIGLAADSQSNVVSDVQQLVPGNLAALQDVNTLQRETGVAGEIDVSVRADDITRPEVIRWMSAFQQRTLRANGYRDGDSCGQARNPPDLCPALSLPDLFRTVDTTKQAQVRGLLDSVPAYFSQGVVTPDRKTANLAFGVRLQSLSDQKRLVDSIESNLDPPKGVTATVVGLPALAAEANAKLSAPWRRVGTLVAALVVVFLVLALARRNRREAAVPLIPIALATGWASGAMFVLGLLPGPLAVELNPMSVTLSALVIAISTEFSVLLSARYRQERDAGAAPARAIERAYASTGAAVMASGVTAIVGFAALVFTDIRLLRDFGILTVVDLGVSLASVMLVLPAALVWAERHGPFTWSDLNPRPLMAEVSDAVRDGAARLPPARRPSRPRVRVARPRVFRRGG